MRMVGAKEPVRRVDDALTGEMPADRFDRLHHPQVVALGSSAAAPSVIRTPDRLPDPGSSGKTASVELLGPKKPIRRVLKRLIDISVAGTALVLLSPAFLMIATGLWLSGTGPVLFAHPRVGRGGKSFLCLKFRTMHVDGDRILDAYLRNNPEARKMWETERKLQNDPRVTPFGYVLRKTSLDELPQFYNILVGHMSCVGPRPISLGELERYGEHRAEYLSVRPGLTGIWQISGRSRLPYTHRVLLDADYVRRWSLRRDLLIMIKTVPALLKLDEAA